MVKHLLFLRASSWQGEASFNMSKFHLYVYLPTSLHQIGIKGAFNKFSLCFLSKYPCLFSVSRGITCAYLYIYIKLSKYRMICIHISVFTEIYATVTVAVTAVSRGIIFSGSPSIFFSGIPNGPWENFIKFYTNIHLALRMNVWFWWLNVKVTTTLWQEAS